MLHFTVEDVTAVNASCQKCCCEKLSLKPGTITKVSVGYAPWAVPIGQLHCAPQFQLVQLNTCPISQVPNNLPPQYAAGVEVAKFSTAVNTVLNGDLDTMISDQDGDPLTFTALPLYGAKQGTFALQSDGSFVYTPQSNYKGEDRFYVSASDGINKPVVFEVVVAIGVPDTSVQPTPHISIGPATVDNRYFNVSFPVIVTPAAVECEVWRLTVLQTALDCACVCYSRTDCFDIGVANC